MLNCSLIAFSKPTSFIYFNIFIIICLSLFDGSTFWTSEKLEIKRVSIIHDLLWPPSSYLLKNILFFIRPGPNQHDRILVEQEDYNRILVEQEDYNRILVEQEDYNRILGQQENNQGSHVIIRKHKIKLRPKDTVDPIIYTKYRLLHFCPQAHYLLVYICLYVQICC